MFSIGSTKPDSNDYDWSFSWRAGSMPRRESPPGGGFHSEPGRSSMLPTDTEIHIQDPTKAGARVLHRGTVAATTGEVVTAAFGDVRFALGADQPIALFFEQKRKFVQQSARVAAVLETDPRLVVELVTTGEPVSAEEREFYRISTVSAEVEADVNGEAGCALVDVSSMGFAIIARAIHGPGAVVTSSLRYGGKEHRGTVCVQSVRDIGRGLIRYGLRYLDDEASAGNLKDGLRQVSLAVERAMLQRRSGNS